MSRKTFDATLEHLRNNLNWIIIRVPLDVHKAWGKRGQLRVQGSINGFSFRSCLFPDGKGGHFLIVNKQMQKGSRAKPGATARFEMEADTEERAIEIPSELVRALKQDRALFRFYESLNPSTRRDISRWVGDAKQTDTRKRRAEEIAERLMLVMEAEKDLPPILQVALARNPKARDGWERMPPSHKRSHLFGIFYYKQPEARARRVAKAVEMMMEYAEKGTGRRTKRVLAETED